MVHTWTISTNTISSTKVDVKDTTASRFASSSHRNGPARAKLFTAARMLFFLLVFALLFSGFMLLRTSASSESVPTATAEESIVYVDFGDTLWGLADAWKDPTMDTRHAVYLLAQRNRLDDSSLYSGQMLIVPAEMLP